MESNRYNVNSRFWLDDKSYRNLNESYKVASNVNLGDIVEKAEILKTISNFVNIVTNKNIPVKFEGQQAKTDGKEIFISANVEDFDLVCGLSLHESSHVLYSQDLHKMLEEIDIQFGYLNIGDYKSITNPIVIKMAEWFKTWNLQINHTRITKNYNYLHTLINIIEDFRIDTKTQSNYPGYKGYYDSLANKYLFVDEVTKSLKSDPKFLEESYFSYKMNMATFLGNHPNNNLLKLKGGKEIVSAIDATTIANKSALDVLEICFKIFEIIHKYVVEAKDPEPEKSQDNKSGKNKDKSKSEKSDKKEKSNKKEKSEKSEKPDEKSKTQEDGERGESEETDEDENEDNESGNSQSEENEEDENEDGSENGNDDLDSEDENEDENEDGSGDNGEDENKNDSPSTPKDLDDELVEDESQSKAFQELMDAISGKYEKSKLSTAEIKVLDLLSNNKFKIKPTYLTDENGKKHKVNVVIVNKLDESVCEYLPEITTNYQQKHLSAAIKTGINLGRSLGSKLQLMNDTHITKSVRRRDGNIDSRLLAEIGHGNVKIFNRSTKTQYEKQFVHISIDSSGSMSGSRFTNSLQMAANIAAAGTFVDGMRVQVSIRSTCGLTLDNGITSKQAPHVIVIYDSKFDKLSHITKWWSRLECPGVTPEAICFEAIKDVITESSKDKNSYFINISDGSPAYNSDGFTYGYFSATHTQEVMKSFKKAGLKIISYFIDGTREYGDFFVEMYGKDAQFVDVQNLGEVARSLNKKFLEM